MNLLYIVGDKKYSLIINILINLYFLSAIWAIVGLFIIKFYIRTKKFQISGIWFYILIGPFGWIVLTLRYMNTLF